MTLKRSQLTELMHAVLDGEASEDDARRLELHIAADPMARAEFEEWKCLFKALAEVPKEHAPEGLVASVSAAAPAVRRDHHQPFFRRRVLGDTRATPSRSDKMTQESSRRIFAHRKAWLGAGIAAAAAVVVAQVAFDFPVAKDVLGTVAPAERYRAAPNGSENVKLGVPAESTANSTATNEASRSNAEKSADLTAQQKADLTAQQKADLTAQQKADLIAQQKADLTAQQKADLTAQQKADLTAKQRAELTAQQTADLTAQKRADLTAQKTADLTAQKTADLTAQKAADMAMQRSEAARVQSQRSMEMSTNRTAP
jgi:hypothetical protein